MSQGKLQAGAIIRKSGDVTWQTPEYVLERVRLLYPGGEIPFDPATALDNPARAIRFCAGPPGTLFGDVEDLVADTAEAVEASMFPALPPKEIQPARFPELVAKNGLEIAWEWPFWVNPPFQKKWIEKIELEGRARMGVALLPCNRFEESYMHRTLATAGRVCFVDASPFEPYTKKISFISSIDGQPCTANPYPSMILGFNVPFEAFAEALHPLGRCFELRERRAA